MRVNRFILSRGFFLRGVTVYSEWRFLSAWGDSFIVAKKFKTLNLLRRISIVLIFFSGAYVLLLLHCLSGGVFLGTFLLHLLPEAVMLTHQVLPEDVKYPVAETIATVGMFLMLLLEQVGITHQIPLEVNTPSDPPGSEYPIRSPWK